MWDIGEYDEWAIKVGYSYFGPEIKDESIESLLLKWRKKNISNPKYRSGDGENDNDPRAVSEVLGNNHLYSSKMGIKNIRLINDSALRWIDSSKRENKDLLSGYYQDLILQYFLLIDHVAVEVLGSLGNYSSTNSTRYKIIPRKTQSSGIDFLDKNCFHSPIWLFNEGLGLMNHLRIDSTMEILQNLTFDHILSVSKFERMTLAKHGVAVTSRVLEKLRKTIWSEVYKGNSISLERRKTQKYYLNSFQNIIADLRSSRKNIINKAVILEILSAELERLVDDITLACEYYSNNSSMLEYLQAVRKEVNELIK